jgi:hypothetical protein
MTNETGGKPLFCDGKKPAAVTAAGSLAPCILPPPTG